MGRLGWILTFIALLLIGFLATPGIFKILNPDYLLVMRDFRAPLADIGRQSLETGKNLAEAEGEIAMLERRLAELAAESAAAMAKLQVEKATPEVIATTGVEFGLKGQKVGIELDQARNRKTALEQQKKILENAQADITKRIEAAAPESTNLYLVTRALALGAIGALMSIFAKFLSTAHADVITQSAFSARTGASMAMGAIAAVVIMGLFFTGFISIFSDAKPAASSNPDYWKVTILCLLAGAFSDRLFQAANRRVEQYLGGVDDPPKVSSGGANALT
jgi:hypothetical protein